VFDNNNIYIGVESLGLHGNWVTLLGFINAHDIYYYYSLAMNFLSSGVVTVYHQKGILRKHHRE